MRSVMSCWVIPEARNRSSSCVLSVSNGKTITEGPRSCGASSELRMCWVHSQPPKTATRIRAVTSSFNPNGHSRFGQGDLLTEVAIIAPPPSLRLGYGLGVRAVWPTAGLNEAGDGKYQIGPVAAGAVSWPHAFVMMAGGLIGGFAGGKLANWLPADRARMIVTAVGTVLTIAYFMNG